MRLHDQAFQVVYRFSSIYLLQEPLLIIGSVFAFFVAAMLYFRLDLSISDPVRDRKALRSHRVGGVGDLLSNVSRQLPGVLSSFLRLSRDDQKAAEAAATQVRTYLADLKQDSLLANCVERLDNALRAARVQYKRALEVGASRGHIVSSPRAGGGEEAEREQAASKLKARVDEAERTLEELLDL